MIPDSITPYYEDTDAGIVIYHGEALEVLASLPHNSIDAVVTDPPYSSGGAFRSDRSLPASSKYVRTNTEITRPDFSGDNRDQRSYQYWCNLWLARCLYISRPSAIAMIFTDWRQLPTTTDALQGGGWVWRGIVPWNKTEAARPDKGRFRSQCEYVVWGSGGLIDNSEDAECLPGFFTYVVKQVDKHHIAGKPTPLLADLLRIVPAGGTVLDPFGGSGTTLVAAKAAGLRAIAIEQEEAYCEIAARRLDNCTVLPFPATTPAHERGTLKLFDNQP